MRKNPPTYEGSSTTTRENPDETLGYDIVWSV